MIGRSPTMSPYVSQHPTPVVKMAYIGRERPPVDFVRHVVHTYGRKASVVSVAAQRPRSVMESIARSRKKVRRPQNCTGS